MADRREQNYRDISQVYAPIQITSTVTFCGNPRGIYKSPPLVPSLLAGTPEGYTNHLTGTFAFLREPQRDIQITSTGTFASCGNPRGIYKSPHWYLRLLAGTPEGYTNHLHLPLLAGTPEGKAATTASKN
jgi:hypothetical protein